MSKTETIEDLLQSILSSVKLIQEAVNRDVGEHNPILNDVITELRHVDSQIGEIVPMLEGDEE